MWEPPYSGTAMQLDRNRAGIPHSPAPHRLLFAKIQPARKTPRQPKSTATIMAMTSPGKRKEGKRSEQLKRGDGYTPSLKMECTSSLRTRTVNKLRCKPGSSWLKNTFNYHSSCHSRTPERWSGLPAHFSFSLHDYWKFRLTETPPHPHP